MSMQWYIIHTYSGFEKKVKESLESRVAAFSLQDKIGRVLIPMEDVVEVRGGKKVVSSRMSYPGYVLVEMDLDENTWHIVRNTPRVTGFVGSATSPSPLSDAEVDAIINRVHTPQDRPKPKVVYERNEQVRIVDGPFSNFTGTVEENIVYGSEASFAEANASGVQSHAQSTYHPNSPPAYIGSPVRMNGSSGRRFGRRISTLRSTHSLSPWPLTPHRSRSR